MGIRCHIQEFGGHEHQVEEEVECEGSHHDLHGPGKGPHPDVPDPGKMDGKHDVLADGKVPGVEAEDDNGGERVGSLIEDMVPVVIVCDLWEAPLVQGEEGLPDEISSDGGDKGQGDTEEEGIPESAPAFREFRDDVLPLYREDEEKDNGPLVMACEVIEPLPVADEPP